MNYLNMWKCFEIPNLLLSLVDALKIWHYAMWQSCQVNFTNFYSWHNWQNCHRQNCRLRKLVNDQLACYLATCQLTLQLCQMVNFYMAKGKVLPGKLSLETKYLATCRTVLNINLPSILRLNSLGFWWLVSYHFMYFINEDDRVYSEWKHGTK